MPFLPLGDDVRRVVIAQPWVNWGLILACVLTLFLQAQLTPLEMTRLAYGLGMIPANVTGNAVLPPDLYVLPAPATLVSYTFLHGSVMHLIGNMLYLWVFGDNVEDAMGHGRYLVFFLLCTAVAGLTHVAIDPVSQVPTIGASGAVSGVLGAYLVLYPRARVIVPIIIFPVFLPASLLLVVWFTFQVLSALGDPGGTSGVAWWAHIGGFVAGALLVIPFRRKTVELFGSQPPRGVTLRRRSPWQSHHGGRPPGGRGPWGDRDH